jgi:putative GTP pyrophosphokinase
MLTQEKLAQFREAAAVYKDTAGALIPVMHEAQEIFGCLSYEVEKTIAEAMNVPLADIYGVATFYSRFNLAPKGRYQINVCMGTACYVKGAQQILDKITDMLGVTVGQTTADGEFSLEAGRCFGCCGLAPVVTVNEEVYGQLTVDKAEKIIKENFDIVEIERKGAGYSFKEFGYKTTHLLVNIPHNILVKREACGCGIAEIQIRTILQDAWAEVEHELVYKAEFTPFDEPMKRKLAAVNASLSLADTIFQEIRGYQRQLNGELGKRRDSFYQKIEESTDALLFVDTDAARPRNTPEPGDAHHQHTGSTVDDMLLNALYAHNKSRFDEAATFYSRILEMKIDDSIRSLIHKHRGMAYFAQSMYQDAIDDFSSSLEWDKNSYKVAYYRGVVWAVMQRYSQAVEDFTLSLTINPYQTFCLFRRAQAYYHIGDYPAALADCDTALSLEPDNEGTHKLREILQEKLKM